MAKPQKWEETLRRDEAFVWDEGGPLVVAHALRFSADALKERGEPGSDRFIERQVLRGGLVSVRVRDHARLGPQRFQHVRELNHGRSYSH